MGNFINERLIVHKIIQEHPSLIEDDIRVTTDFSRITSVDMKDYIHGEDIDVHGAISLTRGYNDVTKEAPYINPILAKIVEINSHCISGIYTEELANQKIVDYIGNYGKNIIKNNPNLQFNKDEQNEIDEMLADMAREKRIEEHKAKKKRALEASTNASNAAVNELRESVDMDMLDKMTEDKEVITEPLLLDEDDDEEVITVLEEPSVVEPPKPVSKPKPIPKKVVTPKPQPKEVPVVEEAKPKPTASMKAAMDLPPNLRGLVDGLKRNPEFNKLASKQEEDAIPVDEQESPLIPDEDDEDIFFPDSTKSAAASLLDEADEDEDDIFPPEITDDVVDSTEFAEAEESDDEIMEGDDIFESLSSEEYSDVGVDTIDGVLTKVKRSTMKFLELQEDVVTAPIAFPRSAMSLRIKKMTQETLSKLQISIISDLDSKSIFNANEVIQSIISESSIVSNHGMVDNIMNEVAIAVRYKKIFSREFVENVIYNNVEVVGLKKAQLDFDAFYMLLDPIDCLNLVSIIGLMVNSDYDYTLGCINPNCDYRFFDYKKKMEDGHIVLEHDIDSTGNYVMNTKVAKTISLKTAQIMKSEVYMHLAKHMEDTLLGSKYTVAAAKRFRMEDNKDSLKHTDTEITLYHNPEIGVAVNARFVTTKISLEVASETYSQVAYKRQIELLQFVKQLIIDTPSFPKDQIETFGGKASDVYVKKINSIFNKVLSQNTLFEKEYIRSAFSKNSGIFDNVILLFNVDGKKSKYNCKPKVGINKITEYLPSMETNKFISTVALTCAMRVVQHINNKKYTDTSVTLGFDKSQYTCPECGEPLGINSDPSYAWLDDRSKTYDKLTYRQLGLAKYKSENFMSHLLLPIWI